MADRTGRLHHATIVQIRCPRCGKIADMTDISLDAVKLGLMKCGDCLFNDQEIVSFIMTEITDDKR